MLKKSSGGGVGSKDSEEGGFGVDRRGNWSSGGGTCAAWNALSKSIAIGAVRRAASIGRRMYLHRLSTSLLDVS